jgi:hypothetical protein
LNQPAIKFWIVDRRRDDKNLFLTDTYGCCRCWGRSLHLVQAKDGQNDKIRKLYQALTEA